MGDILHYHNIIVEEIIERDMAGRKTQPTTTPTTSTHIHLWQFIRELLDHQDRYGYCVRWLSREQGESTPLTLARFHQSVTGWFCGGEPLLCSLSP